MWGATSASRRREGLRGRPDVVARVDGGELGQRLPAAAGDHGEEARELAGRALHHARPAREEGRIRREGPEPVGREGLGDLAPPCARPEPHPPRRRIEHLDLAERPRIDDDAPVVGRAAADPVAAAAHRRRHVLIPGEAERRHDLVDVPRPDDEPGRPDAHAGRAGPSRGPGRPARPPGPRATGGGRPTRCPHDGGPALLGRAPAPSTCRRHVAPRRPPPAARGPPPAPRPRSSAGRPR